MSQTRVNIPPTRGNHRPVASVGAFCGVNPVGASGQLMHASRGRTA